MHRALVPTLLASALTAGAACRSSSAPPASVHDDAHAPRDHHDHDHDGGSAGHHHGPDHFADPSRFVPAWNDPSRDTYQKPEEIVAALAVEPGATVVDLGAGTGYLLPFLSDAVGTDGQVLAADIEPAMLAFLDEAAEREGWGNVRTHQSKIDSPALEPGSVDAIVTLNVWHHIEEREAYAGRVAEALRPGGVFVVVDFLAEPTEGFGPPMAMRLRADQVLDELRAGGLEADVVEETMPRHYVVRGRKPTG